MYIMPMNLRSIIIYVICFTYYNYGKSCACWGSNNNVGPPKKLLQLKGPQRIVYSKYKNSLQIKVTINNIPSHLSSYSYYYVENNKKSTSNGGVIDSGSINFSIAKPLNEDEITYYIELYSSDQKTVCSEIEFLKAVIVDDYYETKKCVSTSPCQLELDLKNECIAEDHTVTSELDKHEPKSNHSNPSAAVDIKDEKLTPFWKYTIIAGAITVFIIIIIACGWLLKKHIKCLKHENNTTASTVVYAELDLNRYNAKPDTKIVKDESPYAQIIPQ